jgi:hypothetical protein
VDEALRRAEAVLGLDREAGGVPEDRIARVYRVRQRGWDRIYPDRDLSGLAGLERRLTDRAAYGKRALVAASAPLDVSARLGEYCRDRRAATEALTGELRRSWLESIEEMKHDRKS